MHKLAITATMQFFWAEKILVYEYIPRKFHRVARVDHLIFQLNYCLRICNESCVNISISMYWIHFRFLHLLLLQSLRLLGSVVLKDENFLLFLRGHPVTGSIGFFSATLLYIGSSSSVPQWSNQYSIMIKTFESINISILL